VTNSATKKKELENKGFLWDTLKNLIKNKIPNGIQNGTNITL
jgi:hypothetical protein